MRLTIGTTRDLRYHLLTQAMANSDDTTFDTVIEAIGAGVAVAFEKWCGRRFYRNTAATFICRANVQNVCVDLFPIESVTSFHLKDDETTGWEEQTDVTYMLHETAGMVIMESALGEESELLKITY